MLRVHSALALLIASSSIMSLSGCAQVFGSQTPSVASQASDKKNVVNDLKHGSVVHRLSAGDLRLKVNYWSTLRMDKWTAAANKPITFSVSAHLSPSSGESIYLSRVSMATAVSGAQGSLAPGRFFHDRANVDPG